jgi:hypothetical protein
MVLQGGRGNMSACACLAFMHMRVYETEEGKKKNERKYLQKNLIISGNLYCSI